MNLSSSPNLNQLWTNLIIEEFIRNNINLFCISPGSRSAPLTVAVATNKKASHVIHFDERGSAFFALGVVSATKRPCVLIATSGTAIANYLPAVVEASKKKLPLIILTADRPPELQKTGADQTIDQSNIYGNYVRWQVDLPCPTEEIKPEFVLTTIDQAIYRSQGNPKGPVHINCMFREPLAPIQTQSNFSRYVSTLSRWQNQFQPYTQYTAQENSVNVSKLKLLSWSLEKIKNGIIVVGKLSSQRDEKAVLAFAKEIHWPIFPDVTSRLRLGNTHNHVIHYFDQILLSERFEKSFKIDGVLHLGGRITSKRWYQYVEKLNLKEYIMVNNHPLRNDPLHIVSKRIEANISSFCQTMTSLISKRNNNKFVSTLKKASLTIDKTLEHFVQFSKILTEPGVARLISQHIPENNGLFLSNSMPIREMDMYAAYDKSSVMVEGNRGASGIDGIIASSCGFAYGLNKPVTTFLGDLAFLHDLNSLALLKNLKHPNVLVVLNNDGGAIFSFLPIQKYPKVFESFFGTPHGLNFESTAKMFSLNYAAPKTNQQFIESYTQALHNSKSTIIEVMTNRSENLKVHAQLQEKIIMVLNKISSQK